MATVLETYPVLRKLLWVLLFSGYCLHATGQELAKPLLTGFSKKNSWQVELFGHGLLYSLNYERVLVNGKKAKTTGQLGASYYPVDLRTLWIPFSVNELISVYQHHYLELGIGHVLTLDNTHWEPFGSFRAGYRYQKPDSRLLFRIGFTPFVEYAAALEFGDSRQVAFYPSGALAVGYSF